MADKLVFACLASAVLAVAAPCPIRSQPLEAIEIPASAVTPRPTLDALLRAPASLPPQISTDGTRLLLLTADPTTGLATWHVGDLASGQILASGPARASSAQLSPDGRTVAFVTGDPAGAGILRVRDIAAGAEVERAAGGPALVVDAIADDGTVAFRDGTLTSLWRASGTTVLTDAPCPPRPDAVAYRVSGPAYLSADGQRVLYYRYWTGPSIGNRPALSFGSDLIVAGSTSPARCLTSDISTVASPRLGVSTDRHLSTVFTQGFWKGDLQLLAIDVATGTITGAGQRFPVQVARGGRLASSFSGNVGSVIDRGTGIAATWSVPDGCITGVALSDDGTTLFYSSAPCNSTDGADISRSTAQVIDLDADNDGLHDAWETAYGLDPSDATDASADIDADGLTAAQEYAAGTHPAAVPVRYFAEGANGTFFATTLALFNPNDVAVTANVRFLGPAGATVSYPVTLPARTPVRVVADDVGLPFTEFSMLVEAPGQVVAERRMTWDRTTGYGSHASSGVEAPATTWHFAEGATISGIQTFVLLQNPGTTPATVTMRYLLSNGTPQERQHVVPAQSRVTVWVNQEGAPMQAAEFATVVHSDQPIVAERAVYRDVGTQVYGAGSAAAGVSAPAVEWTFSEGATGEFFDTFLLLANPGAETASVTVHVVTDQQPFSSGLLRSVSIAPGQRVTLWIDQLDPSVASAAVALVVNADRPILAERAMWWQGGPATWQETHAEPGTPVSVDTTRRRSRWAIAEAEVDLAGDVDTFISIAAFYPRTEVVAVTAHFDDGTSVTRTFSGISRITVWPRYDFPEAVGRRFGVIVQGLPDPFFPNLPLAITVEAATYRASYASGSGWRATLLPDVIGPPQ